MTVHNSPPSTEHGQPAPVDKPRRHWRVTKADLEGQVIAAAEAAETLAENLELLRTQAIRDSRFADYALNAMKRTKRDNAWLTLLALAGWAAFAVAVVW